MSEGEPAAPVTQPASDQPQVRVAAGSGSITVIGEVRADVVTQGGKLTLDEEGAIKIVGRRPSTTLTVRCPEGSDVVVGTRSGSITLQGRLGAVRLQTVSGHIDVETVGSADIRTVSASILVSTCSATCRVRTKSGSARISQTGDADVAVGSGTIEIKRVDGAARARAISGLVLIGAIGGGRILAEAMSGSITISVPDTCRPNVRAKSLTHRPDITVSQGDDFEIVAKTLSGEIRVQPA